MQLPARSGPFPLPAFAAHYSIFGDRPVHLVRSGIDLADFARAPELRDTARRGLGLSPDAPVVGMVACLKPQKAPLDFVDVAALFTVVMRRGRYGSSTEVMLAPLEVVRLRTANEVKVSG